MPEPDANSIAGSNALTAARGSRCFDDCVRPREAVLKRSRRGPTDRLARRKNHWRAEPASAPRGQLGAGG